MESKKEKEREEGIDDEIVRIANENLVILFFFFCNMPACSCFQSGTKRLHTSEEKHASLVPNAKPAVASLPMLSTF